MTTDKLPAHSPLGGSGTSRWSECPASAHIGAKLAPQKSSPYALEGTRAHELAATWLETGNPPLDIDDETFEAISVYVETVNGVVDKSSDDAVLMIEEKFRLTEIEPEEIPMFGSADAVVFDPAEAKLNVFDYKHGVGIPVSVHRNKQLLYYALGVWYKLGRSLVDEITVWIIQPRCFTGDGAVNHWTFGIDELIEFENELIAVVQFVMDNPDHFSAGPWCHFCPVAGMCREQMSKVLSDTGVFYTKGRFDMSNSETLSDKEIAGIFEALPALKTWVLRLEEQAYARAETDKGLPGMKLVAGRRRRRWTDDEAALSAIRSLFGLDDTHEVKLLSPAKIEKQVGRQNMEKLDEVIEWTEGAPRLAPLSDPRPPIDPGVKQAMEGIEDDG